MLRQFLRLEELPAEIEERLRKHIDWDVTVVEVDGLSKVLEEAWEYTAFDLPVGAIKENLSLIHI